MSQASLNKLWSVIASFLLAYLLNAYLFSQGAEPVFGPALFSKSHAGVYAMALVIGPILHCLANLIGFRYAAQAGGNWAARFPVFYLDAIQPQKTESKLYQGAMLVLFVAIPFLAFYHFYDKISGIADGGLWCRLQPSGELQQYSSGLWVSPEGATFNDDCRLGYGEVVEGSALHGITFLPGLEPGLILAFILLDLGLALAFIRRIFFGSGTAAGA